MLNLCAAFMLTFGTNVTMLTKKDVATLKRASTVCAKKYKSCLKRFVVKQDNNYNAICK